MQPDPSAPAVVAVMVTRDPGDWLEEALESIAAQRYPALELLVVDAGSAEDPTGRVGAVLADAYVHHLDRNPGYGRAANAVTDVVEGAVFLLFLHDDVVLDPDAVERLVAEAYRSNAAVVGPKLVDWNDRRRLLSIGLGVDKTGAALPVVERGELDQEQHDAVRDAFALEGGCLLVRADLFAAIGGFDERIEYLGDDIDLCWRAQLAGGRVVLTPAAVARHRESLAERRPVDDRRRLQARHRLRTILVAYSVPHLVRILPQAAAVAVIEIAFALVTGRWGQAREVAAAWWWNLSDPGELLARRHAVQRTRRVSDRELRRLQVRGSARVTGFVRGQLGADARDRILGAAAAGTERLLAPSLRIALAVVVALVAGLIIGSRHLIAGGLPEVGQIVPLPGAADLLAEHLRGWREVGLGGEGPAPTGLGLLGLGSLLAFGRTAGLATVAALALVAAGVVGSARLARRSERRGGAVVAAVVAASTPLAYNALAGGSWDGLWAWATTPALVGLAWTAGERATGAGRRLLLAGILALAVATAASPGLAALAVVIAAGLLAGELLAALAVPRQPRRSLALHRSLAALGVAVVGAAVLHLPWTVELLTPHADLAVTLGAEPLAGAAPTLADLLRFRLGPVGFDLLGWGFVLLAAYPLAVATGTRLALACRAWGLMIAGWGLAWAAARGWLPLGAPPAEVLLAPAATGVAVAAGAGAAAFATDLPGHRFGLRQVLSAVAGLSVAAVLVPWLVAIGDGAWRAPATDRRDLVGWLDEIPPAEGQFRVVWIGEPARLPVGAWGLDDGLGFGVSFDGLPDARQRWATDGDGATARLAGALRSAVEGRTAQLGRLLGPLGVRFVVVDHGGRVESAAGGRLPAAIVAGLDEQVDLRRRPGDPSIVVYENALWVPRRAAVDASTAERLAAGAESTAERLAAGAESTAGGAAGPPLSAIGPALTGDDAGVEAAGPVPAGATAVYAADASTSRWRLRAGDQEVRAVPALGWSGLFGLAEAPGEGVQASLRYRTSPAHWLLVAAQAVLWLSVATRVVRGEPDA